MLPFKRFLAVMYAKFSFKMTSRTWFRMKTYLVILIGLWIDFSYASSFTQDPRKEFYHYASVQPVIYTTTERIASIKQQNLNAEDVTVNFEAFGKKFVVNLRMNKNLLPKNYFEKYQENEHITLYQPIEERQGKHCHYQGKVEGVSNSWAALSLCDGISGVIHDGEELYYVEPNQKSDGDWHFVFKSSDMKPRSTRCGVEDRLVHSIENQHPYEMLRHVRSNPKIPLVNGKAPRIVETLFIVANNEYVKHGNSIMTRCQSVANIVNAIYAPLNIVIVLIGIIIWDSQDKIQLTSDSQKALDDFLEYRKNHLIQAHPNDNAVLFTSKIFDGGVVGKAYISMICKDTHSGELIVDDSDTVGQTAMTTAHELGHNFGMWHDDGQFCQCSGQMKCIMYPAVVTPPPMQWSNCSIKYLNDNLLQGIDYCMKNKPDYVLGPICGNGVLEDGEECDCGPPEFCSNRCCNAATCTLAPNAACATGSCCDINACQIKRAGTSCRNRANVCDLPEFCDGSSEFCPDDFYRQNGIECGSNREGYCFDGKCRSHEDQCKLLWGPTGQVADSRCYDENTKGDRNFNCGVINKTAEIFKPCDSQDSFCGRLQCADVQIELQLGDRIDSRTYSGYVLIDRNWYTCRTVIVELGLRNPDPGLTPNGAKCSDGKACLNQRCVPVSYIKSPDCPSDCNSNGVCNNKGHCHCNRGYAPPDCQNSGFGGSIDSGPEY